MLAIFRDNHSSPEADTRHDINSIERAKAEAKDTETGFYHRKTGLSLLFLLKILAYLKYNNKDGHVD